MGRLIRVLIFSWSKMYIWQSPINTLIIQSDFISFLQYEIRDSEDSKIFSLPTIHMNITMRYGRVKMVPRPTSSTAKTVKYPKKTGLKVHYSPILQRKGQCGKAGVKRLRLLHWS